ncbi:unnamed protein product [Hymenolepis diminuta]|uniref:SAM domain-containing protein n=1 Tax=Hymenolepis diminuta TaxID=6216 RepID=A0A0R3SGM2_HYMDI|nr:unnamed protein product [Hymenolepis diminuta]
MDDLALCLFMLQSANGIEEDNLTAPSTSWNNLNGDGDGEIYADEEYLVAPPAWYHHSYNRLTAENYESLALFCLDMGLRELGVAFAVRAHQESKRRESPDLCSSDWSESPTSSHILTNGDTPFSSISSSPNSDFSYPQSPKQLPNLSLPLLRHLNLPVSLRPDEDVAILEDNDMVFSVRTSHNYLPQQSKDSNQISNPKLYDSVTTVRRRLRGSILKPPSFFSHSPDDGDSSNRSPLLSSCGFDDFSRCESPNSIGPGSHPSPKKRVRFSLSASHPPPHLEAQFGGRSNSQRLQDMARRRSCRYHLRRGINEQELDGDADEDSVGAFDRLVGIFWPDEGRFRWCFWEGGGETLHDFNFRRFARCIGDVAAFLGCLIALLLFCLLFLSLVICIPLTWFSVDGNAGITAGTCIRLLNAFGLHALLAR